MILSVPQQIQRALLSGDLDHSLEHLRMALTRDELGAISEELKVICLSNVLRKEQIKGMMSVHECITLASHVLCRPSIPLAALLVQISLRGAGEMEGLWVIDGPVLEALDVLALDSQVLTDSELLAAAHAISS